MCSSFRPTPGVSLAGVRTFRDRAGIRAGMVPAGQALCLSIKIVPQKMAALQDGQEVPVGMLKNRDVRKRIALDDQEIRALARIDRADLLRKAKQVGGSCRRRPDQLGRRLHRRSDSELLELASLHRAQEIGTVDDLDAPSVCEL